MFEHVGPASYASFFGAIKKHLAPDGVAVIHSIGRMAPPGGKDPWIGKYIFPGGYIPSLSETLSVVEQSGLWVTDIEVLRLHYAETLRHWYERFQARRAEALELFDERFCLMWEYYLAACEMMFRNGDLMVFQLQVARKRDAVPLTREYLYDTRREVAAAKAGESMRSSSGCGCSDNRRLPGVSAPNQSIRSEPGYEWHDIPPPA
jgi:cyclopropane-fatty-acyl-phospholipid synthase